MEEKYIETKRQDVYCNLLTKHVLSVMSSRRRQIESELALIQSGAARTGSYPDGTLLIEGENTFEQIWQMILRNQLVGEDGVSQPMGFRSLAPFADKACILWYTGAYREKLGELDFSIIFPSIPSLPTTDYDLKDLLITVGFPSVPSEEDTQKFAEVLGKWSESISTNGLFREGPIRLVSKKIEFRGRLAQFRIDASASGQDTLNWLLLSVVDFGYSTFPVVDFVFDHQDKLQQFVGRSKGATRSIPFGAAGRKT